MAYLKNCSVNPNKSFLSSVEWILSPRASLLGWGPEGAWGRELVLSSLASSQCDSKTVLETEKLKGRRQLDNLLLWTGLGCPTSQFCPGGW